MKKGKKYGQKRWILFRLGIFLILATGISYLALGSFTGLNRIAIPLDFDGFCQVEVPNNVCYLKYGAEKVNGELIKLSKPIDGLATTERWQSIFQLPIGIFDKVLCTEIHQPSSLIQGVIVRLNGETKQTIAERKCDVQLIKNGEIDFKLENPELENLEIKLEDKKFQEVMLQSTQAEFVPGPMRKASELNSTIYFSVELKNRYHIWIVYFFAGAISANLILVFLELYKFIFKGSKQFIE